MKKQVIIALALFVSVFTFAQKKEVKALINVAGIASMKLKL